MKSKFFKKFNHNLIASDYDKDISNENNPIRTGYKSLLNWVNKKSKDSKNIIDFGCGTGNTSLSLSNFEILYCVDISTNMLNIAKQKFKNRGNIIFIEDDLLNFFNNFNFKEKNIDSIISTYAIHHLTQEEKHIFFQKIYNILPHGGKIIFGDLMFKNKEYKIEMKNKYPHLLKDFESEFYWDIEEECNKLKSIGFILEIESFSDLSRGIFGIKN